MTTVRLVAGPFTAVSSATWIDLICLKIAFRFSSACVPLSLNYWRQKFTLFTDVWYRNKGGKKLKLFPWFL